MSKQTVTKLIILLKKLKVCSEYNTLPRAHSLLTLLIVRFIDQLNLMQLRLKAKQFAICNFAI